MKVENGKVTLSLGSLVGIVVVLLMVIVGLVVYKVNNNETNVEEAKSNAGIEENTSKGANETVSNTDAERESTQNTSIASSKKDSDNDFIVLFHGCDIKSDNLVGSIEDTKENKEKYEITYYNYENGKFVEESQGKLVGTYEGCAQVDNTKTVAISKKYDAIPRKYKVIDELPKELMEFADSKKTEIQEIDLDGDGKVEYVMAYQTSASPKEYDVKEYSNYSEILVFDNNFKKIATLVKAENQYWENNGEITDEFFCSLDDVEYIDIDNDGKMEILVDTNVYEGVGLNIYRYENGKVEGKTDFKLSVLP